MSGSQQRAVTEAIDADAENAAEIFDRLNLRRFCGKRTFSDFVKRRRREQAARVQSKPEAGAPERVTFADLEEGLSHYLMQALNAGRVRPSLVHEIRLLLADIRKYRADEAGGGSTA